MGKELGLVIYDDNLPLRFPYRPENPKNFKAGQITVERGQLVLTEESSTFPKNMPTKKQFASMLNGEISFI